MVLFNVLGDVHHQLAGAWQGASPLAVSDTFESFYALQAKKVCVLVSLYHDVLRVYHCY